MIAVTPIVLLVGLFAAKSTFAQDDSDSDSDHGEEYSETMGPVAFMWPPDRVWGAAQDNTAPCGSASGVANRTQFPLRKFGSDAGTITRLRGTLC